MLFGEFHKRLNSTQEFDADAGRRFARLLENDTETVQKWFIQAKAMIRIHDRAGLEEGDCKPDFVVKTFTHKSLCGPKWADDLQESVVLAKGNAAAERCTHTSNHEKERQGKQWSYLLNRHDAVTDIATLVGLATKYANDRQDTA